MDKKLKNVGLKATKPRLSILKALMHSSSENKHLSAENLYQYLKEQGTEIGLGTIYRVLAQFEAAGLVIRHQFEEDSSVFEVKPDEHHDHLVCTSCGTVVEFLDLVIEARQQEIAKKYHFKMTNHNLILYGTCEHCKNCEIK